MKKLLYLFFLLILNFTLKAQYPITQNLGSDSTLIRIGPTYNGAIKGGLINMAFNDTTDANLSRISFYTGAQIWTNGDSSLWVRKKSIYGSYWFKVSGSGAGPSGSGWQVSATGQMFPVTVPYRGLGTDATYGGAVGLVTNGVARAIVPNGGFVLDNDTTNKIFTWNPSTKDWGYANWNNGGSSSEVQAGWALRFSHSESKGNVWAESVYPINTNFKKCLYEFWVAPDDSAEYVISTGYGGSHEILFGFGGGTSGKLMFAGNMYYNGSPVVTLNGQDTVLRNTVHIIAVAYDGTWVTTFLDGVPSKRVAYTGYRNGTTNPADIDLFIGGSDHSKFDGLIFKARGFETFENDIPISTTSPYAPKLNWQSGFSPFFSWDFTTPMNTFPNAGVGLLGTQVTGTRNVSANYNEFISGGAQGDEANMPQFEQAAMTQAPYTGTPPSVPGSAKVFDSFHRRDRVPAWMNTPDLDSTEGGTVGKKKWLMNLVNSSYNAGIIHNNAYFALPNFAYIDAGSPNDSIIVTKASSLSETSVYVVARRSSDDTYILLINDASNSTTYLYNYVTGSPTSLGSFSTPSFTTMTLVVNGNQAQVYTDGTHQIVNANITGTTGNNVGFGAGSPFVRISKFECY